MIKESINLTISQDIGIDDKPRITVTIFMDGQSQHGRGSTFGRALIELGAMLHNKKQISPGNKTNCERYSPDYQAMNDCRHCGRLREDHTSDVPVSNKMDLPIETKEA